jgi:hypothetical protein
MGVHRCGGVFWGEAQEFGAITFFAPNGDIPGIVVRDTDIIDSTYDGIRFKWGGGVYTATLTNVRIDKSNNGRRQPGEGAGLAVRLRHTVNPDWGRAFRGPTLFAS